MTYLEVCIEDVFGLDACLSTNVTRVELCSTLSVGGLTPSYGFINLAAKAPTEVHALIRPRAGNFNYSKNEVALMCDDIAFAIDAGVTGVVIGAANQNDNLDLKALRQLATVAGHLDITLHRVIDTVEKPLDAMEQVIDLGFSTILTSGGKPRAQDGVQMLAELNKQAENRIKIMAGAGLKPTALAPIHQQTGITCFHSSCSKAQRNDSQSTTLGFSATESQTTDAELIRQFQLALDSIINT